jgi:DNA-directed RNA polymerase specialized sigma24 family protein
MNAVTSSVKYISEEKLVAGLLNNDQACFSEIYELYSGRLFGLILKWVKEHKTAEILLCHSFIKAWQQRCLFNAVTESYYCWLCRQARICYHEYAALEFRKNI